MTLTLTLNTPAFRSYTAALEVVDLSASSSKAFDGVRTAYRGERYCQNSGFTLVTLL
jgi:hypothetical protein